MTGEFDAFALAMAPLSDDGKRKVRAYLAAPSVDATSAPCQAVSSDIDDMPRGGYRPNAGRKSAFPGKVIEKPVYMDFTPEGHRQLKRLVKRSGLSRNDVIGHLAIRYVDGLVFDPDNDGVVFAGKRASNVMAIRLNQVALEKFTAAEARTGKSASDIGEALVRIFGPGEKSSWPVLPGHEKKRRRARKTR